MQFVTKISNIWGFWAQPNWLWTCKTYGPQHNKTNKMTFVPSEDSAWASAQSAQSSLSTWRNIGSSATHWAHCKDSLSAWKTFGPQLPIERTVKTLIRMGGCPGWSESSLGANIILLVLSWSSSFIVCLFCHTENEAELSSDDEVEDYEVSGKSYMAYYSRVRRELEGDSDSDIIDWKCLAFKPTQL